MMTNREWLNGLSDEELVRIIRCIGIDDLECRADSNCDDCKLEWLKKERKEECRLN